MFGEHHCLSEEFPDLVDKIHQMKITDPRFATVFDSYNEIDKELYRIEE
jgi:hypothetical protein